ncbi:unnamed protein product [Orchesella dallaii]|uniref:Structural maintenance of chromosomes protein 6 n=1 Tax=Orchesella dallaii TaxID=48710 RepID=A0ABP1R094_9HEXA
MEQPRERLQSCIPALISCELVQIGGEPSEQRVEELIKPKERCFSLSVVELSMKGLKKRLDILGSHNLKSFKDVPDLSLDINSDSESSYQESETVSEFPSTSLEEYQITQTPSVELVGTLPSFDNGDDDDVFNDLDEDSLDDSSCRSSTIDQLNDGFLADTEEQLSDISSSVLSISFEESDSEWDFLEAEKESLWILHKRLKKQRIIVQNSRAVFETKIDEICKLNTEKREKNALCEEIKEKIRVCKETIKKLEEDDEEVMRMTENLHNMKKEACMKLAVAQTKYDDLRADENKYSDRFDRCGRKIRLAVEERTTSHINLESLKLKLTELEVADTETGLELLDDADLLQRIESDYDFYPNVDDCDLNNIGNTENPKKSVEAIDKFVEVIRANVHRFKHLPMGPLFHNVTVLRKRFSHLFEYVLRPYLFTFLVDNIVDGLVMEELLTQHFSGTKGGSVDTNGIIRPKYCIYDFNSKYQIGSRINAAHGLELENLYDGVHFDDQLWGKFLSEKMSIEKIIMMDNESMGFMLMSNLKRNPEECTVVYTLDGFAVAPFPCFRTKRINIYPYNVYLKSLPDPKIEQVKKKIKDLKQKMEILEAGIYIDRQMQYDNAEELDKTRKEMLKVHMDAVKYAEDKDMAEAKLKKGISVANENRVLQRLKRRLGKIKEQINGIQIDIDETLSYLNELEVIARDEAIRLDGLEYQFNKREQHYLEKRDYLWKLENASSDISSLSDSESF